MQSKSPAEMCLIIAKRLKARRLYQAWTRKELAEKAKINEHTLKQFELRGQISLSRLVAICDALGMEKEVEQLFLLRHRVNTTNGQVELPRLRRRGRKRHAVAIPKELS